MAKTKSKQDAVTALRLALLTNGYLPIPVTGKRCILEGWTTITPTEVVIHDWARDRAEQGTGVLTRTTPALDIDIEDAVIAEDVEAFTRGYFAGAGRLMRRVGQAPKRAFLFRTEVPFAKLQEKFIAPDGSKHKLEILGDGQMLAVDSIHPDTREPYTWAGGTPWEVPAAELPELTGEKARAWLDEVTKLLVKRGWQRESKPPPTGGDPAPDWLGTDDDDNPWRQLNSAALANLVAWVPALFGNSARKQPAEVTAFLPRRSIATCKKTCRSTPMGSRTGVLRTRAIRAKGDAHRSTL
jgi:Bifunctional DNA primase/polymerase, N-terminal